MSEVCNEIIYAENIVLSETHAMLKHNIKTGVLAQIRVLEYLLEKLKNSTDTELVNLLKMSYETSLLQYGSIAEKIKQIENLNLDIDLCLT